MFYNMNESLGHYANELASHKKTNTVFSHLYEVAKVVKLLETKNGGYQGLGRRGNKLFSECNFSFASSRDML